MRLPLPAFLRLAGAFLLILILIIDLIPALLLPVALSSTPPSAVSSARSFADLSLSVALALPLALPLSAALPLSIALPLSVALPLPPPLPLPVSLRLLKSILLLSDLPSVSSSILLIAG